ISLNISAPDTTGMVEDAAFMGDQKGSSYLELSLAIKAKAHEKEQLINRYYEKEMDSIAGKISASDNTEEILALQDELQRMEQKKKDDLKVVKVLHDLSKQMIYKHRNLG